jgi:2-succinyl-5-enolpyruvyl-6-hydroxy-3-cyclohexene-1-carboxylate synthase
LALRAAAAIVDELARSGVRHACVCPGARSAPLALALAAHEGIHDWVVTDERSAGFFALGMARQLGEAVALVCTSGTAAANLLPAVAEAFLSEVSLVVLTADRPPELRDCGAPQTIDQIHLYGSHVRWSVDLPGPCADIDLDAHTRTMVCRAVSHAAGVPRGPVHLNVPLREPLVPAEPAALFRFSRAGTPPFVRVADVIQAPDARTIDDLVALAAEHERGLVVAGPRAGISRPEALASLATRLAWPLLADPLSGLRFGTAAGDQADGYDLLLRDPDFRSARPDVVLQLGALPVSRALQTYLAAERAAHHIVITSPGTWPDPLHAASLVIHAAADAVVSALLDRVAPRAPSPWYAGWRHASRVVRAAVADRLESEAALFEGKVFPTLLETLPAGTVLHVGNSMPVRDLDTFGAASARAVCVAGNRGANGIDGVLSSALGAAATSAHPVVLVVGDLSFLHDVGALQIAARHGLRAVVVVVNNDGGGVFSFLPQARYGAVFERHFGTPHGFALAPMVEAAGGRFRRIDNWAAFRDAIRVALGAPGLDVVEVPSNRRENVRLHRSYVATARHALAARRRREAAA